MITSLYFWLGPDAEHLHDYLDDKMFLREEIERHQAACKPEADGWITLHPRLNVSPKVMEAALKQANQ